MHRSNCTYAYIITFRPTQIFQHIPKLEAHIVVIIEYVDKTQSIEIKLIWPIIKMEINLNDTG